MDNFIDCLKKFGNILLKNRENAQLVLFRTLFYLLILSSAEEKVIFEMLDHSPHMLDLELPSVKVLVLGSSRKPNTSKCDFENLRIKTEPNMLLWERGNSPIPNTNFVIKSNLIDN